MPLFSPFGLQSAIKTQLSKTVLVFMNSSSVSKSEESLQHRVWFSHEENRNTDLPCNMSRTCKNRKRKIRNMYNLVTWKIFDRQSHRGGRKLIAKIWGRFWF